MRFYNNERRANILLKQFQSDTEVKIGEYNSIENKLMFESGERLKWVNRISITIGEIINLHEFVCFVDWPITTKRSNRSDYRA